MEKAISTIKNFNLTKDQIDNFVSQVLNQVHNQGDDVLQTTICLKAMEDVVKKVRAGISDLARDEAEKYIGKSFDYKGATVSKVNRTSYDYSACSQWNELNSQKKELEGVMKTISKPVADADTGEMISPAQIKITESLSIKIK